MGKIQHSCIIFILPFMSLSYWFSWLKLVENDELGILKYDGEENKIRTRRLDIMLPRDFIQDRQISSFVHIILFSSCHILVFQVHSYLQALTAIVGTGILS
jgi:hypothetical protein